MPVVFIRLSLEHTIASVSCMYIYIWKAYQVGPHGMTQFSHDAVLIDIVSEV